MHKQRLLKLADLLETNAKNKKGARFDMFSWGKVDDPKNAISCGTHCCAMGLAALSGQFKRAGLLAVIDGIGRVRFRWKGRPIDGNSAAEKLFGISADEALSFFSPRGSSYDANVGARAERHLAKTVREFVAENT